MDLFALLNQNSHYSRVLYEKAGYPTIKEQIASRNAEGTERKPD